MMIVTRIGLAFTLLINVCCDAETNAAKQQELTNTTASASIADKPADSPLESAGQVNCIIPNEAFTNIADQVLVFTDVEPISNFKAAKLSFGSYKAETGGAELSLQISEQAGKVSVKRTFVEPGLTPEIKIYSQICNVDSLLYGDGVRGKFVKDGFLWLELDSDNDFIPADLWFLLERQN